MNKPWAVASTVLALVAGGLMSPGSAAAATPAPIVVNFTSDSTGIKPNGFSSAGAPHVSFYATGTGALNVQDWGVDSHGKGLGVTPNDDTALDIRLSAPANSIRLAFGHDDPNLLNTSDLALLRLFRGAAQVGQVQVNFNANEIIDQTIGISGQVLFNRAIFQYVDAFGTPLNVAEIVDDIVVGPLCTITGTSGNNHLVGTAGNDVICGDAGRDTIRGRGGADVIYGGAGNDTIRGGKGKDHLIGGTGKDHLTGGKGKDELFGGKGRDQLSGGKGRDHLRGGTAQDHCDGGTAHDTATSCEIRSHIP
jgi:Ca2+-binding RTX toxin-like protein